VTFGDALRQGGRDRSGIWQSVEKAGFMKGMGLGKKASNLKNS
jgi:hypothetical protein